MTPPKEKALELCQKIGVTTLFANDCNDGITLPLRIVKKIALIAVDELIESTLYGIDLDLYEGQYNENCKEYWQQVKQETHNL